MAAPASELRKHQGLVDPTVPQTHAIAAEIATPGDTITDQGNSGEGRALALLREQRVVPRRGGALTVPQKLLTGKTQTINRERVQQKPQVIEGRCRVRDSRPNIQPTRVAHAAHATEEENIRTQRASARPQSTSVSAGTKTSIRTLNLVGYRLPITGEPQTGKSTVSPRPATDQKDDQPMRSPRPTSQAPRLKPTAAPAQGLKGLLAGFLDTSGDVTVIPADAVFVSDGPRVDFWESMTLPILGPFRLTRWLWGKLTSPNRAIPPVSPAAPDWQPQPITTLPARETTTDLQFVWIKKHPDRIAPAPQFETRQTRPTVARPEPLMPEVERIPSEQEAQPLSYYQIIPARQNPALSATSVAGLLASGIPLWSSTIINLAHTKAASSGQAPIARIT